MIYFFVEAFARNCRVHKCHFITQISFATYFQTPIYVKTEKKAAITLAVAAFILFRGRQFTY